MGLSSKLQMRQGGGVQVQCMVFDSLTFGCAVQRIALQAERGGWCDPEHGCGYLPAVPVDYACATYRVFAHLVEQLSKETAEEEEEEEDGPASLL